MEGVSRDETRLRFMYLDLGLTLKSCNGFCIVTKYYVEQERKRKAILKNQKQKETNKPAHEVGDLATQRGIISCDFKTQQCLRYVPSMYILKMRRTARTAFRNHVVGNDLELSLKYIGKYIYILYI